MKLSRLRPRLLALVVSLACGTSLAVSTGAPASAQPNGQDGMIVRQQLTTGNELLVYVPDDPRTGLRARSNPILIVFADRRLTRGKALATAESSGLAEIAEAEHGVVAFVNPIGKSWAAADTAAVPATLARFDGFTGPPYDSDGQLCRPDSSGQQVCKFPGMDARVYLFGDRAGADFIAQHVVPGLTSAGQEQPWTPTAVYLSNPTRPAIAPDVDVEVPAYVVNGSKAVNASLERLNKRTGLFGTARTQKTGGFHRSALLKGYDQVIQRAIQRRWRLPAQIYAIPDYDKAGLRVSHRALDVNGVPLEYVEYAPRRRSGSVPLVLVFHGYSDHAEYMAWSAGWVEMAAKHGFMVVSVDQHGSRTAAEIIALLDHLLAEHPRIDERRVYATGFSMGSAKTWALFDQYADRFAAVAPMGGAFGSVGAPAATVVPTIYFAGMESPLAEWPHKDGRPNGVDARLSVLFARNDVTDSYAFDGTADPVWGITADESITVADDLFTDISVKANAYTSRNGNTYTVLAEVHHATHETVPIEGETAWAFLSQFSRTANGDVVIKDGAFDLSALGSQG